MLKLERMEISGFKSFGDRTEIRFPEGITAIVGPNGCGKSNIGDAINWVLGEQSAKMLRGKHMADVIFNGCDSRKPLGLAEVALHFAGAEGLPHADGSQVAISRRLFRSGESDYRINGHRARLKDIQELLEQGRVGARSYATIEQGRIDQILNAKPKERRAIIEDAAGISGYKHKRRLTELKLEATHANLLRVNDIVVEVERQIRSLKRQASKARRYRRLRERLREQEQIHFGLRAREADRDLARVRETENRAADAETRAAASLARLERDLIAQRESLERLDRAFRETAERLHALERDADRAETQVRTCRERIAELEASAEGQEREAAQLASSHQELLQRSRVQQRTVQEGRDVIREIEQALAATRKEQEEAERRRDAARAEIETLRGRQFESMNRAVELRNRLRNAEEESERCEKRAAVVDVECAGTREERARLRDKADRAAAEQRGESERVAELRVASTSAEDALRAARQEQDHRGEELVTARELEKSTRSRLETLEDVTTRFAGSDGVRTVLTAGADAGLGIAGVVADYIEVSEEVENAAEGYLRAFLPTIILENDGDLRRAHELIRSSGAGRTSLVSRSHPSGGLAVGTSSNGKGELPAPLTGDPRVRGRLRDRLTLRSTSNGMIRERVGDAVLVDDLEAALDLHRRHPSADYVTLDGDVVWASGVVSTGGEEGSGEGLLAHSRRVQDARTEAGRAAERVVELQTKSDAERARLENLERAEKERREELARAEKGLVELEMRARIAAEECARAERQSGVLADELAVLTEERERLRVSIARLSLDVAEAEGEHETVGRELQSRCAVLAEGEDELKRLTERGAGLRADLAARQERQEANEHEDQRLADAGADLDARIAALRDASAEARRRVAETAELQNRSERGLTDLLAEREELAGENARVQRKIAEGREKLTRGETEQRGARAELESLREVSHAAGLERTKCESSRAHLDELCRQELGLSAVDAAAAAGDESLDEADPQSVQREVTDLRQRIENIGPVNMTAIEEFTELEERHAFLTAQRKDLDDAMTSLRETIRRVNRSSRERFQRAFEAIRLSFQEVFQTLFQGGRADLRLEEGEDLLECGIEILVQPPGKRLGLVQLMSGGEKALSAIALLFAVFRFQPSPFCLLDEVDAALDDANVGRFARLLTEYARQTQFVIVTHNKLSMESAHLLYGVTMEEPGVSKLVSIQLQ